MVADSIKHRLQERAYAVRARPWKLDLRLSQTFRIEYAYEETDPDYSWKNWDVLSSVDAEVVNYVVGHLNQA